MGSLIAPSSSSRPGRQVFAYVALSVVLMLTALFPAGASDHTAPIGTPMVAYPAGGQSPEQQEKEQFRCHEQAVKESKYNPRTAYAYIDNKYGREPNSPTERGFFGRSGRTDAAGGAAIGTVAAGVTAGGAAVGAVAGVVVGATRRGGQARRQQEYDIRRQEARHEREHTMAGRQQVYEHSWAQCMQALGYTTP